MYFIFVNNLDYFYKWATWIKGYATQALNLYYQIASKKIVVIYSIIKNY